MKELSTVFCIIFYFNSLHCLPRMIKAKIFQKQISRLLDIIIMGESKPLIKPLKIIQIRYMI